MTYLQERFELAPPISGARRATDSAMETGMQRLMRDFAVRVKDPRRLIISLLSANRIFDWAL